MSLPGPQLYNESLSIRNSGNSILEYPSELQSVQVRPLQPTSSATAGEQRAEISNFQAKLKNEHKKKAELEQKIQLALRQKKGSPGTTGEKASREARSNWSPTSRRRMYRHPREMEQSLLQAEEDFADAQGQVESLEAQLSQTRSELVKKTDALKNSEQKVETLLSMLNELMTRLAKKELGGVPASDASVDQLWTDPVNLHFLDDGNMNEFIDEKLERIASSLSTGLDSHNSGPQEVIDYQLLEENAREFWRDIASSVGNEKSLQFYEFEFAVRKTNLEPDVQTGLLRTVRDMIPQDVIGECAFSEDEFIACVQHSTDNYLLSWFCSYAPDGD